MIEKGYCHCGCGQKTKIAAVTNKARGWIKGEPVRYVNGHSMGKPRDGSVSMLRCCACKEELDLSCFYFTATIGKYSTKCKKCQKKIRDSLHDSGISQRRVSELRKVYGLTPEEYLAILDEQENTCPICQEQLTHPCVDHDHRTGKIRGILCKNCNVALGHLKDSPDMLRRAARYLEEA